MNKLISYLHDFVSLIFPDLCAACGRNLFANEASICTKCVYNLPLTNFYADPDNKVAKQFWGRIKFVKAHAFLYFQKGTNVQNLMHQLKYNNRIDAGIRLGELYAHSLINSPGWVSPDVIIPVPLHKKKQQKRGYNQSEAITTGMSKILGIPVDNLSLQRTLSTQTQTHKSRFSRYENMLEAFQVISPQNIENKHILLIDDVITTGATLEACALLLCKVPNATVSIGALAFAD